MQKVLVIDNYDSFTYNITNIFRKVKDLQWEVIKSDRVDLETISGYSKILFSPGPDIPRKGNIMWKILEKYGADRSILGICLGFQAIGTFYGAPLKRLQDVYHGQQLSIHITDHNDYLFDGISNPFLAGFYHSWGFFPEDIPDVLTISSMTDDRRVMSFYHPHYDIRGVQFHPESIMTPMGEKILCNWLSR